MPKQMISKKCVDCGAEYSVRSDRIKKITCNSCSFKKSNKTKGATPKYDPPPQEVLRKLHHENLLSRVDLSKKFGVTGPVIDRWFRLYGIEFLPRKQRKPSKNFLIDLHINQKKTIEQIALNLHKAPVIVQRWLEEYGIERQYHRSKRTVSLDKTTLIDLHINQKKTFKEISEIYGVSDVLVGIWFKEANIENIPYAGNYGIEEDKIRNFVNDLGFETIKTRKIISPYELDIYIPSKKLAIEYCGLRWHDEISKDGDQQYHLRKLEKCRECDIDLITIFEDEWLERPEIVKSIISNKLGKSDKLNARTCQIRINEDVSTFLNDNHLQGRPNKIHLSISLHFNGVIVGAMTFGPHHRKGNGVVLNRLCFLKNVNVRGGTQKMFAEALKYINDPIITWSDRRWSEGKVYEQLGFKKDQILKPDYWWCKQQQRKNKQSMTKKIMNCPLDTTEKEWNMSLGWNRIWDCGKIRFVYDKGPT